MAGKDRYSHLAAGSQLELLQTLTEPRDVYCCPGETLPISSAIHEARLRTQYHKCRDCPHREDVSTFSAESRERIDESWNERQRNPVCREDGFRGILWNELTPAQLARLSAAVCQDVWQNRPAVAPGVPLGKTEIVVGHDGRATALQSVDAIASAVGEQGLRVINIGETSSACMQFAVSQLNAAAGLHATAANSDRLSIGLDVFGPNGLPLSGESLLRIEQRQNLSVRCRRVAGGRTQFPARKAYLGSLWKHFQGVPSARVLIRCQNDFAATMLAEIERDTEVAFVHASSKTADLLVGELSGGEFELAVLLGEDGQTIQFATPSEGLLAPASTLPRLLDSHIDPTPQIVLIGEECTGPEWTAMASERIQIRRRQSLREHFARGMNTSSAIAGVDRHQRYWFPNGGLPPVCDGLVTLGRFLQKMSQDSR